jgi:hypothetical protein
MSGLGKRLDAPEQIAEAARLRPYRELAAEHGIPLDALMAMFERAKAEVARGRAEGLTEEQIVERKAAALGISPEQLRREADEIRERFNGA